MLEEQSVANYSWKEWRPLAKAQMANDLELLLKRFKNRDIGLRIIGEKTSVNEKTLKRILAQASEPHLNTILSFYNYFFQLHGEQELNEFQRFVQQLLSRGGPYQHMNYPYVDTINLEEMIINNKVFREIYLYSRAGSVTRSWVVEEFGKYGADVLNLMLKENILLEIDKNLYTQGPVGVDKPPVVLKAIISDLLSEHLDQEKLSELYQNFAFYLIEGVNEETKLEVLRRMDIFYKEMAELIFNVKNKGTHRLFILGAIDQLKEKIFIN